jgi:hypothetical protein
MTLEELKKEATQLGIEFPSNVSKDNLEALITSNKKVADSNKNKPMSKKQRIAKSRQNAMKLRKVRITNLDKRDSDMSTTAYLGFENQYFGISRLVPLDIDIELEQALCSIAESLVIVLHKDEVVNGKRTGNKISVPGKRYSVQYLD